MVESATSLLLSVLLSSLLGSPHCAAMCGGFSTLAGGSCAKPWARVAAYHVGRLVTYILVAVAASQVTLKIPPLLFGVGLALLGFLLLCNVRVVPSGIHRMMSKGYRHLISKVNPKSALFPLVIGTGSTLLPCGWLYAYVGIASSSSNPALTMIAFWLGTLPILSVWAAASSWFISNVGIFVPQLRALLLIAAGTYSIIQHAPFPNLNETSRSPHCIHSP